MEFEGTKTPHTEVCTTVGKERYLGALDCRKLPCQHRTYPVESPLQLSIFIFFLSQQGSINSETELSQYFLQDGTSQLSLSEATITGSSDEEQRRPKSGSSSLDESLSSPGLPSKLQ